MRFGWDGCARSPPTRKRGAAATAKENAAGVGVRDAVKALKKLELDPQVLAAIEQQANLLEDAFTACRANSFPAGTRVLMADGSRRAIREVREGDLHPQKFVVYTAE